MQEQKDRDPASGHSKTHLKINGQKELRVPPTISSCPDYRYLSFTTEKGLRYAFDETIICVFEARSGLTVG